MLKIKVKGKDQTQNNDIWKPYIKIHKQYIDGANSGLRGVYISNTEREKFKEIISETIKRTILPWAERKFKALMTSNAPRSVFGFFTKEAPGTPRTGDQVVRPDWELRFAADFALMLQDYPSAVTNYRRLWDKIQKGIAYNDIGTCREFMAISALASDGNQKDFLRYMENACQFFINAKNFILLAQNAIYTYDILMILKRYSDASDYIGKISQYASRESELSGLFLEQSAFTLLNSNAPSIRKFAKYILYAGTLYTNQSLSLNAIYCLATSYYIYEQASWPEILIYICNCLGKSFASINDLKRSFSFFKKLFETSIQWSKREQQSLHLEIFLNSASRLKSSVGDDYKSVEDIFQMNDLLLVYSRSVTIYTNQDRICSNNSETPYYNQ